MNCLHAIRCVESRGSLSTCNAISLSPAGSGRRWGIRSSLCKRSCRPLQVCSKHLENCGYRLFTPGKGIAPICQIAPSQKKPTGSLRIGDPGPKGRILVLGEPGIDFVKELLPQPDELVIDKPGKGAFSATNLHERLQALSISHLIFAGLTTEVCVQTSIREANDRGHECLLMENGTESCFPEFKQATLRMIQSQGGIVGWVTTVSRLTASLRQTYG